MKDGHKPVDPVEPVRASKSLNRPAETEKNAGLDDETLIGTARERLANPRRVRVSLKDL
ncbi:hypothetical protein CFII64_28704 [Pseudomonas sp. CFII64]|nr:hypothetical protein CFII64_28704 [Pseudomonas sp. CFII64]